VDKRRIIGIIGIIIGLIGWFALEQETSPGIYNYLVSVNVLIVLVYTWLLLSLGTKIAMVFKKRWWILPFSSCVLLAILFFVASMFVDQIVPFESHIV